MAQPLISRCPVCGALGEEDAAWCGRCGADLRGELVELVPAGGPPPADGVAVRGAPTGVLVGAGLLLGVLLVGQILVAVSIGGRSCRPAGAAGGRPLTSQCSGTVLVVEAGARTLTALDLDRGRTTTISDAHVLAASAGVAPLLPSDGRLPIVDHGEGWAVPVAGGGRALPLGPAEEVLDDGTGGWWLVSRRGVHGVAVTEVRRVRGDGATTGRPIFMSPAVVPLAGTAQGLLVTTGDGHALTLVGDRPRLVGTRLSVHRVVAAHGDRVLVLADLPGHVAGLWLLDLAGGGERYLGAPGRIGSSDDVSPGVPVAAGVALTPAAPSAPGAKFSPDGRWLAVFTPFAGPRPDLSDQLTLVDVRTGAVLPVAGAGTVTELPSLGWSADSRWVFFLQGGGPTGRTIGAYRLGDRTTTALDYFAGPVEDLAGVAG